MTTEATRKWATMSDGLGVTSDDARFTELLTSALGRSVTIGIAAPSEPSLGEYWPDLAQLAYQQTGTDEAMPAGTFFDLTARNPCAHDCEDQAVFELYLQDPFEVRHFRPNVVVRPPTTMTPSSWRASRCSKDFAFARTSCSRSPTIARAAP